MTTQHHSHAMMLSRYGDETSSSRLSLPATTAVSISSSSRKAPDTFARTRSQSNAKVHQRSAIGAVKGSGSGSGSGGGGAGAGAAATINLASPTSSASSSCDSCSGSSSGSSGSEDMRHDLAASLLQVVEESHRDSQEREEDDDHLDDIEVDVDSPNTSSSEPCSPAHLKVAADAAVVDAAAAVLPRGPSRKMGRKHSDAGTPETGKGRLRPGELQGQPSIESLANDDDDDDDGDDDQGRNMRPAPRKVARVSSDPAEASSADTSTATSATTSTHSINPQMMPVDESPPETEKPHSSAPSMDIPTFPTASLLHLLAQLLSRITERNDVERTAAAAAAATSGARAAAPSWTAMDATAPNTPAVPSTSPAIDHLNARQASYLFPETSTSATPASTAQPTQEANSKTQPRYTFSAPPQQTASPPQTKASPRARGSVLTSAAAALATPNATLCFHARNVPSITIESYLVRISKCRWSF